MTGTKKKGANFGGKLYKSTLLSTNEISEEVLSEEQIQDWTSPLSRAALISLATTPDHSLATWSQVKLLNYLLLWLIQMNGRTIREWKRTFFTNGGTSPNTVCKESTKGKASFGKMGTLKQPLIMFILMLLSRVSQMLTAVSFCRWVNESFLLTVSLLQDSLGK